MISGNTDDIDTFSEVWGPVTNLAGIEIGYVDGAGLDGGGEAVTLWLGSPDFFLPLDIVSYPDTAPFDGQSYDSDLGEFSVPGNANDAVETIALGGDNGDVSNIGSPGNQGPITDLADISDNMRIKIFPNPSSGRISVQQAASHLDRKGQYMDSVRSAVVLRIYRIVWYL